MVSNDQSAEPVRRNAGFTSLYQYLFWPSPAGVACLLVALAGCGGGDDSNAALQAQSPDSPGPAAGAMQLVASASANDGNDAEVQGDVCKVNASWTGGFNGAVEWVPDKAPGHAGFTIEGQEFSIEIGRFNLTARFEEVLNQGSAGTYTGEAAYFYVTDAPYEGRMGMEGVATIGFPMHHEQVAQGVPLTLEIDEWEATSISGSVSAGPFTGVASGPQAPRDGGPNGPLKPITVSVTAQFNASRDFSKDMIDNMVGRRKCHQPYVR